MCTNNLNFSTFFSAEVYTEKLSQCRQMVFTFPFKLREGFLALPERGKKWTIVWTKTRQITALRYRFSIFFVTSDIFLQKKFVLY